MTFTEQRWLYDWDAAWSHGFWCQVAIAALMQIIGGDDRRGVDDYRLYV